ncbi:hypothetical protein PVK06_005112 [Gossypium arboreum]|uniref:Uncharacterized protein n=1 Tax=Gossypium arboreum TaxID=29729 RepID=A0ABR0QTR7_GOSAR|nr:hypothetical protein PVK06_005112 [Gossypium arboreum]
MPIWSFLVVIVLGRTLDDDRRSFAGMVNVEEGYTDVGRWCVVVENMGSGG